MDELCVKYPNGSKKDTVEGKMQAECSDAVGNIIHQEINQRLINNFRSLEKICQNRMLRCYDYQGGWQAMIELPEDCCDEETAIRLLRDHRVLVHPGFLYNLNHKPCWVLSLLIPEAQFSKALNKISKYT